MAFRFLVLAAFVAAANAGVAPLGYAAAPAQFAYAQPVAKALLTKEVDPNYDPNPQYSYAYDVQDGLTGDNKQHQESRNGDVVEGSYSFIEADGTRRTVHYTADPLNGFNAVVDKESPVAVKAIAAPVIAKAAPVIAKAAPFAYAAPAAPAYVAHAAPIAHPAPIAYHAAPEYGHAYADASLYH